MQETCTCCCTSCCPEKKNNWVRGQKNSCCQFCAYCLKDCGRDAHAHVGEMNCLAIKECSHQYKFLKRHNWSDVC